MFLMTPHQRDLLLQALSDAKVRQEQWRKLAETRRPYDHQDVVNHATTADTLAKLIATIAAQADTPDGGTAGSPEVAGGGASVTGFPGAVPGAREGAVHAGGNGAADSGPADRAGNGIASNLELAE